jgi:TBC1 domain family member 13
VAHCQQSLASNTPVSMGTPPSILFLSVAALCVFRSRYLGLLRSKSFPSACPVVLLSFVAVSLYRMEPEIIDLLAQPVADLDRLRFLASKGIPDKLRATVWSVLLGYLPVRLCNRAGAVASAREQYSIFLQEVVTRPQDDSATGSVASTGAGEPAAVGASAVAGAHVDPIHLARVENVLDDPLTVHAAGGEGAGGSAGKWEQWHKDQELRLEIDKDLTRTNPSFDFFCQERNLDAMRRILFVYAKLNSGVRYVQGMNEVLAPLWWALATSCADSDAERAGAEADCFYCFMLLMAELRDLFIKSQDTCSTGVYGLLRRYGDILERREPALAAHLRELRIEHSYYAFRWVTTLLSREFELPDVLMLWDAMFADPHRFVFLLHLCAAMLRRIRARLLAADFGKAMKLLQNYPVADMRALVDAAYAISAEEAADGVPPTPTSMSPAPSRHKTAPRTAASGGEGAGSASGSAPGLGFPESAAAVLQQPHAVATSVASALHSAAGSLARGFFAGLRAVGSGGSASSNSTGDPDAASGGGGSGGGGR